MLHNSVTTLHFLPTQTKKKGKSYQTYNRERVFTKHKQAQVTLSLDILANMWCNDALTHYLTLDRPANVWCNIQAQAQA